MNHQPLLAFSLSIIRSLYFLFASPHSYPLLFYLLLLILLSLFNIFFLYFLLFSIFTLFFSITPLSTLLLFSISNRLTGRISNLSLPTSQNFEESGGGTATSEELHDQLVLIIDDITSVRATD